MPGRFLRLTVDALVYFATIALRATQPYRPIRSESRFTDRRTLDTSAISKVEKRLYSTSASITVSSVTTLNSTF